MVLKSILYPLILTAVFSFCTKDTLQDPINGEPKEENSENNNNIDRITGITMVAIPDPFVDNPIPPIQEVNAQWISLVPYAYTPLDNYKVYYNSFGQWWGETPEGLKESAKIAHEKGIKVMLKPQVYIPNGWVGDMDFDTEETWEKWEKEYAYYIMTMVDIANDNDIEMLCIGTEYKIAMQKREAFWRDLITEIRSKYNGKILYTSNWDSYADIAIWDTVDYIGISAYFPLSESVTPSVDELTDAWKPIIKKMKKVSKKFDKPVLFTEYGYLTVDKCAHRCWELEKIVKTLPINQQAQANAYEALYANMTKQDFWMGGFLWKWFPNDKGDEGYIPRDYTPQHKLSEAVVRKWYAKF